MSDFKQLIQLRNSGKTQEEISQILGISRRSVVRYLKDGKIPIYSRKNKSNRDDPMKGFLKEIKSKLSQNPKIELSHLYEYIKTLGYTGSERTVRRKTRNLRLELKSKEVFFQREVLPGEVMEGDFTEIHIEIAGHKRKVQLWVCSLPFSNSYFATPYYHSNFECFADGTVKAFNEFGGVAKKYRLDNMTVAVSRILMGKNRNVTARYSQLQCHYGFAQDFCNPARGNEKGNVEANNRFLKNKILSKIGLTKQKFINLHAFEIFVAQLCREHNKLCETKFSEEKLSPLPAEPFSCFRTEVVNVNKYSLFGLDTTGHLYSTPSKFLGLSMEIRVFPDTIEVVKEGEIVCSHPRLYGPRGLVSIMPEHIITALTRKPGAMSSWKHRHILFERPAWKNFYDQLIAGGGKDKDYLKCLELMSDYGREVVSVAMELALESNIKLNNKELKKIIINDLDNVHSMKPIRTNLCQYDFFLKGETNGS